MPDLRIADGFYLNHKIIPTISQTIITDVPTNHIVVIDCSGSMYNELPRVREQLKNKLPMMVKEADTVSIVWFSGRKQYGVVVEAVAMKTAVDLTGVHRAIDNFLKPIGLTGFVEPLEEVANLIGRVQRPGYAVNLFFMSDGCDNQWSQDTILKAVEKLQPLVSSAAVVEYGWYCNKPLMVKMSESLGASEVLAENFLQYEPLFETAMTKRIAGVKKVEIRLETPAQHGFAYAIGDGEILTFAVNGQSVMVPEGLTDLYWFAEVPATSNVAEPGDLIYHQRLYAGLVPLTQRMLSTDIFRVLKATGDVHLIRMFSNCFGKQAYRDFQESATECVFDIAARLLAGYNPDEVPAEDAFTIIDLLYLLAGDDGNKFYPNHKSFNYERIGRKALAAERVLTEDESRRVAEIAMQLQLATSASTVNRLRQELSGFTEKRSLTFTADDPDSGYPVSALVLNEDRPNISAQVRIPGTVNLESVVDSSSMGLITDPDTNDLVITKDGSRIPVLFPTHIFRNYTIVRDGIRNVNTLPVSLTANSFLRLAEKRIIPDGRYDPDRVYEIDLTKIPLINRKMVKSVSAKELFQRQYDLLVAKSAQKVFNHYHAENFPPETTKGLAEQYGRDAAEWLAGHGIKDYGYSPKVELAEATESYYGKELSVSIAGLSSLPSVKSVLDKIEAGKKLTARESVLTTAINEVKSFLSSSAYTTLREAARDDLLKVWLTDRRRDTIAQCRQLMRGIAQIKFSVIVGQAWFQEFSSLDENSLTMHFNGSDIVCSANLNEIEIKV